MIHVNSESDMGQGDKLPHFIIVGTMKGGTSALYDFITLHPDIERATKKEIHYFSMNYHKGHGWYLSHFHQGTHMLTGEASPTYFDTATTLLIPSLIKSFNPAIKILLIVRDPIERAISHYSHLRRTNQIQELVTLNIDEFFNLPLSAAITETTTVGFYLRQVLSFSLYYRKYLYYREVFRRRDILVVSNDKLKEDPFGTMRQVYSFVGVEPYECEGFKEVKYSLGTNVNVLNSSTRDRLAELLYPDYRKFWETTEI